MARLTLETRSRVVYIWQKGFRLKAIQERLKEEGVEVSKKSLCLLIKKFKTTGSVRDNRTWTPPRLLQDIHLRFIDQALAADDELTSRKLLDMLCTQFPDLKLSISTNKKARRDLGWSCKKTRYCALISEVNKDKRLEWCKEAIDRADQFEDVTWTDECIVHLESHRKMQYRKKNQPPKYKGTPKHPPKINLWGGISQKGATPIVLFTGTMVSTIYTDILSVALLPFLAEKFPAGHQFQQDNDPKHEQVYTAIPAGEGH